MLMQASLFQLASHLHQWAFGLLYNSQPWDPYCSMRLPSLGLIVSNFENSSLCRAAVVLESWRDIVLSHSLASICLGQNRTLRKQTFLFILFLFFDEARRLNAVGREVGQPGPGDCEVIITQCASWEDGRTWLERREGELTGLWVKKDALCPICLGPSWRNI